MVGLLTLRETNMPIFMTARYRVKPESMNQSLYTMNDLVDAIQAAEPGTLEYSCIQDFEDSFSFLHFFVFTDENAEDAHRGGSYVAQFMEAISPNLESDVLFERWNVVASTIAPLRPNH